MDSKRRKYLILGIVFVLILSLGGSYAYFKAKIKGEGAPITLSVDELKVLLIDTEIMSSDKVKPGWKVSKTFTVENQSDIEASFNITIKNLINTFVIDGGLQYKITSSNGYNMSEYLDVPRSSEAIEKVLAYNVSIAGKQVQQYTIEFIYNELNKDQSEDMGKTFSGNLSIVDGTRDPKSLYSKLLQDNPTHTGSRPGAFSSVYTADNTGVMYVASGNQTEDGSNVYYFAGNAKNNWVRFGKDSTGADLYWRIIRTNEDGSVRMLYAGTSVSTTAGYINASQAYNPTRNNPMYVGYMYGSSGSLANNRTNTTNSPIKTVVDNWYNAGLNSKTDASGNKYDAYISQTAIYCNDRANEGYSTSSTFYYATYKRLIDAKAPSYKCGNNASGSLYTGTNGANVADKFSKNTSKGGNGKLTYPVALMTADEISFAGGLYATNAPAWYYYNSGTGSITGDKWWWTMSPCHFNSSGNAYVFRVYGSAGPGGLGSYYVNYTRGVRPVVSLKSCALASGGNGSSGNPYTIQINSTCASAVN